MTDFVQTMKNWSRMCLSFKSCNDCPMMDADGWTYILCSEGGISSVRPEVAEKVIVKWATEHPAPVYPTWAEWLYEQGLMTDVIDGKGGNFLYNLASEPIPADIAQKLGIEPKEG